MVHKRHVFARTSCSNSLFYAGFIEYIIPNSEAKDKFTINDAGLLHTKVALDREEQDEYRVVIAMGRRGVIRGKEVLEVDVKVIDENDNSPSFDR